MPDTDAVLKQAQTVLGAAQNLASLTPIPHLTLLLSLASGIITTIQNTRAVQDGCETLALRVSTKLKMVISVLGEKTRSDKHLLNDLEEVEIVLQSILTYTKTQQARSQAARWMSNAADSKVVAYHKDELDRALENFGFASFIRIRQGVEALQKLEYRMGKQHAAAGQGPGTDPQKNRHQTPEQNRTASQGQQPSGHRPRRASDAALQAEGIGRSVSSPQDSSRWKARDDSSSGPGVHQWNTSKNRPPSQDSQPDKGGWSRGKDGKWEDSSKKNWKGKEKENADSKDKHKDRKEKDKAGEDDDREGKGGWTRMRGNWGKPDETLEPQLVPVPPPRGEVKGKKEGEGHKAKIKRKNKEKEKDHPTTQAPTSPLLFEPVIPPSSGEPPPLIFDWPEPEPLVFNLRPPRNVLEKPEYAGLMERLSSHGSGSSASSASGSPRRRYRDLGEDEWGVLDGGRGDEEAVSDSEDVVGKGAGGRRHRYSDPTGQNAHRSGWDAPEPELLSPGSSGRRRPRRAVSPARDIVVAIPD